MAVVRFKGRSGISDPKYFFVMLCCYKNGHFLAYSVYYVSYVLYSLLNALFGFGGRLRGLKVKIAYR